jgi:CheY-like chemotaxis protein
VQNIIINLGANARDAMPEGGRMEVAVRRDQLEAGDALLTAFDLAPGPFAVLSVRDRGNGMSDEISARAFEPFFTTKPSGLGTGLGLASVYASAREHGGAVRLDSRVGEGTTVEVWLPLHQGSLAPPLPPPAMGPVAPATVLLVDDELVVRTLVREILTSAGHTVIEAEDGQAALAAFRGSDRAIEAVVLDMVMPRMDGLQSFRGLRALDPHIEVVICTGYAEEHAVEELRREGITAVLPKPFYADDLLRAVGEAIQRRRRR